MRGRILRCNIMRALASVLTLSAAILLTDALRTSITSAAARWAVILVLISILLYISVVIEEREAARASLTLATSNINGRPVVS